jgi:hypothetical protein
MAETSALKIFRKKEMITVAEFADRLGISRTLAYDLVSRGQANGGVLAFRFGLKRALRIPLAELDRVQQDCRVEEEER